MPEILAQAGLDLSSLTSVDLAHLDEWLDTLTALTQNQPDILETLLVRALQMRLPRVAEALIALKVVTVTFNGDFVHHFNIDWARAFNLVSNPQNLIANLGVETEDDLKILQGIVVMFVLAPKLLLRREYERGGFGSLPSTPPLSAAQQQVKSVVHSPVKFNLDLTQPPPTTVADYDAWLAQIAAPNNLEIAANFSAAKPLADISAKLTVGIPDDLFKKFVIDPNWSLALRRGANFPALTFKYADQWSIDLADPNFGKVLLEAALASSTDLSAALPGILDIEIREPSIILRILNGRDGKGYFSVGARVGRLVVALGAGGNALSILGLGGDPLRVETDLVIDYVQGKGLRAQGNDPTPLLGIRFVKSLNKQIGIVKIGQISGAVYARLAGDQISTRLLVSFSASAQFGPINLQIEDTGAEIDNSRASASFKLVPPNGVGMSVDAGVIAGGGFLQMENDSQQPRYSGALQLKVMGLNVFAFGILSRTTSGKQSFIAVIGVRFPLPGIQIGFGFAISGIGGLIGINRRADTDQLRERLSSGAAGNVLFCDNPIQNAPTILGDLNLFFPTQDDSLVIGPTLQINWLVIVRFDLAIIVQLPAFDIIILGSARLVVGDDAFALMYLRLDIIGEIDPSRQLIAFDAHLVNSQILGILSLTGGVAFRLHFGDNPFVVFSVGGFHPRFDPGPLQVPLLERAGASLSSGGVAGIWMRAELYVAFTSNSFQFGGRIDSGLVIGPISAKGFIALDALIQFNPFYFTIGFAAGMSVEVEGHSLASVQVSGSISGPGPVVVRASASVSILFFDVSADVTFELGSHEPPPVTPLGDLAQIIAEELRKPESIRSDGQDAVILLKPRPRTAEKTLISPLGNLVIEQKRAPLDCTLERFDGVKLAQPTKLTFTCDPIWNATDEKDYFGANKFRDVDLSTALNQTTFENLNSGKRLVSEGVYGDQTPEEKRIDISLVKIPNPSFQRLPGVARLYMTEGLTHALRSRGSTPSVIVGEKVVSVGDEQWHVYDGAGNVVATEQSAYEAVVTARQSAGRFVVSAAVDTPVEF